MWNTTCHKQVHDQEALVAVTGQCMIAVMVSCPCRTCRVTLAAAHMPLQTLTNIEPICICQRGRPQDAE